MYFYTAPQKPIEYDSECEFTRQKECERKFFRKKHKSDWKHTEQVQKISSWMHERRTGIEKIQTINLTAVPARIVILAENEVSEISFSDEIPDSNGYFNINPKHPKKAFQSAYTSRPTKLALYWTPCEEVVLQSKDLNDQASIRYTQKAHPHKNHKGDCRVDFIQDGSVKFIHDQSIGSYADIQTRLEKLIRKLSTQESRPEFEKKFAKLIFDFPARMQAITLQEIATTFQVEQTQIGLKDVQFINSLCYLLFVKEIARRKNPNDLESHDLPLASSLYRALMLVIEGYLYLHDVIGPNAPFGPITGSNIGRDPESARTKIKYINRLFFRHLIGVSEKTPSEKDPSCQASSQKTFQSELRCMYGGASDTDSDCE